MKLAILGRQPELSIAELESLFGAQAIRGTSKFAALVEAKDVNFSALGGTQKLAEVVDSLDTTEWSKIAHYLTKHALPEQVFETDNTSKKRLGISAYGLNPPKRAVTGLGLELKKKYKKQGWSIGVVPNKSNDLSSAQVLHNNLYIPQKGREIILATIGDKTIIALTTEVQDIDAYSDRDHDRPELDAYVGMLPPKLAQMIINLAAAENNAESMTILDPFCGMGTILQESLLMGYEAHGTDISQKMVDSTSENLDWLARQTNHTLPSWSVEKGDATNHNWTQRFSVVASELYLGEPQESKPTPSELSSLKEAAQTLIVDFLRNIQPQANENTRFCLAVPAWRTARGFEQAISVDDLVELGYTPRRFEHVDSKELIYARDDQIVGRKLLVFTK